MESAGDRASSVVFAAQKKFIEDWPDIRTRISALNIESFTPEDVVAAAIGKIAIQNDYVKAIKGLDSTDKSILTAWLQSIAFLSA